MIFRLNTLKSTAKAPAVDLLRLNTLKGTKTAFFTPKRYDEHPRPFYMEVFPPLPTALPHQPPPDYSKGNKKEFYKRFIPHLDRLRLKITFQVILLCMRNLIEFAFRLPSLGERSLHSQIEGQSHFSTHLKVIHNNEIER